MIPSAEAEPDRYQGKPLLIILENYILDCIGALEPDRQELVRGVVQRSFGGGDDWKQTIRSMLQIDGNLDEQLRLMWEQNQEAAQVSGIELHPVQFAKMVADQNFADLIDPNAA
jgi:hypothetical protein